jgi:hypothetical protein
MISVWNDAEMNSSTSILNHSNHELIAKPSQSDTNSQIYNKPTVTCYNLLIQINVIKQQGERGILASIFLPYIEREGQILHRSKSNM